jgi:DNA-binding NarL/FixJ family response regulator
MKATDQDQVTVFVVDDNETTRYGITAILSRIDGIDVVGQASDGQAAVDGVLEAHPNVVIMDIGLPTLNGIEATRRIKASGNGTKIVMLTSRDSDADMFSAFEAGADGYIVKEMFSVERLEMAVRNVAEGIGWLDPSLAQRVLAAAAKACKGRGFPGSPTETVEPLSDNERELLEKVANLEDEGSCKDGICSIDPEFLQRLRRFG